VVKLTGDPAFERLRWRGAVAGDVEAFQRDAGGTQAAVLRRARDATLRRAAHVFTPSSYLRSLVVSWGVGDERVEVLPNPAPAVLPDADREELRRRHAIDGFTLVFAGRLTAQKALPQLLDALAEADGVQLAIAGEGPERPAVESAIVRLGLGSRTRLLGAQPRETVLELFAAADAAVLSSAWENFPHTVVEALAAGTPVLATDVGGVAEVVRDGVNGLLVPPGDRAALVAAIRRLAGDPVLCARLRAEAAPSVGSYAPDVLLARVEQVLQEVAR
jgi:glycosyltransferase involved in cell wall biosynthesis